MREYKPKNNTDGIPNLQEPPPPPSFFGGLTLCGSLSLTQRHEAAISHCLSVQSDLLPQGSPRPQQNTWSPTSLPAQGSVPLSRIPSPCSGPLALSLSFWRTRIRAILAGIVHDHGACIHPHFLSEYDKACQSSISHRGGQGPDHGWGTCCWGSSVTSNGPSQMDVLSAAQRSQYLIDIPLLTAEHLKHFSSCSNYKSLLRYFC